MTLRTTHTEHGELMLRVAEELAHLCRLSVQIEQALSRCTAGRTLDRRTLCDLQAIDRLSQCLADLTQLMQALAADSGAEAARDMADLLPSVCLRDMAERLFPRGATRAEAPSLMGPTAAGEVHFF